MAAFSKQPDYNSPELAALEQRAEEVLLRDDEAEYLVICTEISAFKEKNLPPSPWASKSSISKRDALAAPGAAQNNVVRLFKR